MIPWKTRLIAAWYCLRGKSVALGIESEGGISIRNDRGGMVAYCHIHGGPLTNLTPNQFEDVLNYARNTWGAKC